MPRIIEKTVFKFSELSDSAKERAREWYRSCDDRPKNGGYYLWEYTRQYPISRSQIKDLEVL